MRWLIAQAGVTLTDCSIGHYEYRKETAKRVDMIVTGIPAVPDIGTPGTTIPLTPEYSLTAAHVAKYSYSMYRVKAWHPECDIAVVYHENPKSNLPPPFRNSHIGDHVNLYSYSFFSALPVASNGKNLTNPTLANDRSKPGYVVAAAHAGVVKGNHSGKTLYKDVALYVPHARFQAWLDGVMG